MKVVVVGRVAKLPEIIRLSGILRKPDLQLLMTSNRVMPSEGILSVSYKTFLYIFNLTLPFLMGFSLVGKNRMKVAIL